MEKLKICGNFIYEKWNVFKRLLLAMWNFLQYQFEYVKSVHSLPLSPAPYRSIFKTNLAGFHRLTGLGRIWLMLVSQEPRQKLFNKSLYRSHGGGGDWDINYVYMNPRQWGWRIISKYPDFQPRHSQFWFVSKYFDRTLIANFKMSSKVQ